MNDPTVTRHWLAAAAPKAAPAIATTTVLALARIWNANGAEHSVGNAVLMTGLSLAAAGAGVCASIGRAGDPLIAGTAFAASGGLVLSGIAAYSDGMSLPLLLWAISTVLAYALAARYWREARRETAAFERQMTARREDHRHAETVEVIRARAQVEAAHETSAYTAALAQAIAARQALPGFDPAALLQGGAPRELPAHDNHA
ncbi:hypothetical protein [Streptomyces bluensis]|uniref:Uncharacterized protein n=1 Tax=Streptomyces bluensis TaxID=33897 RepID=A0ABW6UL99_9ACTN